MSQPMILSHPEASPILEPKTDNYVKTGFPNPEAKDFKPGTQLGQQPKSSSASPRAENDVMMSVVRELRKPQAELKRFSGDPLEYRRFLRQFKLKVESLTQDYDERMSYLDQYTTGEANRIVSGYNHLEATQGYPTAVRELERRYGDTERIASAFVKKALEWPTVRSDDAKGLDNFCIFLTECENAVTSINAVKVLEYSENLRRLVAKLPYYIQSKWRALVFDKREFSNNQATVQFSDLVTLIRREARKANDPIYGRDSLAQSDSPAKPAKSSSIPAGKAIRTKGLATNVSDADSSSVKVNSNIHADSNKKHCLFCDGSHLLENCTKLTGEPHEVKIDFIKSKGLCFGCLLQGHRSKFCKKRLSCSVCKKQHPSVLHKNVAEVSNTRTVTSTCCSPMGAGDRKMAMSILPVRVEMEDGTACVETYALLDSGSTATFCSELIMHKLKASGPKTNIILKTMGHETTEEAYLVNGMMISALDGGGAIKLPPVISQATLPVSLKDVVFAEDLSQWSYLRDVTLPKIEGKCHVGLIIGINAPQVMEPHEVIGSEGDGPFAVRTKLGWVVNGPLGHDPATDNTNRIIYANRIHVTTEDSRQEDYRRQISYDFSERTVDDVPEYSREDRLFLERVTSSVVYEDGHYTIGLPFRNKSVHMPFNRSQAEQRLRLLGKRLEKNPTFHSDYRAFMENILDKGYAREVNKDDLKPEPGKSWYLPHHGVYHPQKNKLRVVFDCAARYAGTSLNDQLLSGPNLTNNLVGTLHRFRQGEVAVVSDIEAMFCQVRVPPKDATYQRFLWWRGGDLTAPVIEYQMLVHLFGATCSPSCASFALLKTADDNEALFGKMAADTLRKNCYVDDSVKSVDGVDNAVQLSKALKCLTAKGGFKLTKWLSNERAVMDSIPTEEWAKGAKNLDLECDNLPVDRALGVKWDAEFDNFVFEINLKEKPATRRGILSLVSSIYDPLGFIAPCILPAKSLLQELCRLGLSWDDPIPRNLEDQWSKWKIELEDLSSFSISRCVKPKGFGELERCELHHFSDASETGYGIATYFRLVNTSGEIHCSLVTGKSRVTPLKQVTIPRLELTAATVAVRTDRMLRRELELPITESYFWVDSMSVLRYVHNKKSRFHTFVANRLVVIHEGSEVSQWRYVNTKVNPADEASRGQSAKEFIRNKRWINGPSFLWQNESEWPDTPEILFNALDNDPEVKRVVTTCAAQVSDCSYDGDSVRKLIDYHSDWMNLKRSVAWLLRVRQTLLERVRNKDAPSKVMVNMKPLTVHDMDRAEIAVIQHVQRSSYSSEINALQGGTSF
jgi:hypothetical protein